MPWMLKQGCSIFSPRFFRTFAAAFLFNPHSAQLNMVKEDVDKLKRQLLTKQLQIDSLLEVTKAINSNYASKTLFRIYEFILRAQIGVDKLAVFHKNEIWTCVCCYGLQEQEAKVIATDVEKHLVKYKEITRFKGQPPTPELNCFEMVIPVYHKDRPLAYLLLGDLNSTATDSPDEKIKFIQTITNIIIVAIENKRLFKQQLLQERLNKELEVAAQVQNMMVPKQLPNNHRLQMSAIYLPHNNIGGDYYDYVPVSDDEFMICIADISGKGIAAALLMANVQAVLRALAGERLELKELIAKLNRRVMDITGGDHFVTLFIAHYHFATRKLHYINAGHNPPVLLHDNRQTLLQTGCTVLGILDKLPFIHEGVETLQPGTLMMAYTDGLVDLENETGEYFTEENLYRFLAEQQLLPVSEITTNLVAAINAFKGTQPPSDDITFLNCRFI